MAPAPQRPPASQAAPAPGRLRAALRRGWHRPVPAGGHGLRHCGARAGGGGAGEERAAHGAGVLRARGHRRGRGASGRGPAGRGGLAWAGVLGEGTGALGDGEGSLGAGVGVHCWWGRGRVPWGGGSLGDGDLQGGQAGVGEGKGGLSGVGVSLGEGRGDPRRRGRRGWGGVPWGGSGHPMVAGTFREARLVWGREKGGALGMGVSGEGQGSPKEGLGVPGSGGRG